MKNHEAKNDTAAKLKPEALTILQLDGSEYLLPTGANIPEILKQLAGIRRLRTDHFYYIEPNVRSVTPSEEVEVGVASWRRVVIDEEQRAALRAANDAALEATEVKRKAANAGA